MDKKIINSDLIIKYLVKDDIELYKKSRDFFDLVKLGKTKAILEQTIFTETITNLNIAYQIPRNKIAEALIGLLEYKGIFNPEKEILIEALAIYKETNFDIIHCIILAKAKLQNIELISFDQKLVKFHSNLNNTFE